MVHRLVVDPPIALRGCVSVHQTSHRLYGKTNHLASGGRQSHAEGRDCLPIAHVSFNIFKCKGSRLPQNSNDPKSID